MNRLIFSLALLMLLLPGCSPDDPLTEEQSTSETPALEPAQERQKPKSPVSEFTKADIQNWCIAAYKGLPDSIANLNEKIEFYEKRLEAAQETGNEQAVQDVLRLKESAIVPATDLISLTTQWEGSLPLGLLRTWVQARDERGIVFLWQALHETKELYRPSGAKIFDDEKKQAETEQFYNEIVGKFEKKLHEFRGTWPEKYVSQLPPKE